MSSEKYLYEKVITELEVERGETSHGKLLQMIPYGSTVLECGPAYGIMTKYMKEKLNCSIYIIEADIDCYRSAIAYADGGVCANLEDDCWMGNFSQKSFDIILFADVLEHLRSPQTVLSKMRQFLKQNGLILLSVPNIAHGDIIMNLLCDQFTYTPTGLLDTTHIHFFARESLHSMIQKSNYYLIEEVFMCTPLFLSEQAAFLPKEKHIELERALKEHSTRNVYQFVCKLALQEENKSCILTNEPEGIYSKYSRFYYDIGCGFNENNRIDIVPEINCDGRYHYKIHVPSGCHQIRFDPLENQSCFLIDTRIQGLQDRAEILSVNGLRIGRIDFFSTQDPQLLIKIPTEITELELETQLIPLGVGSWIEISYVISCCLKEMGAFFEEKEKQLRAVNEAKEQAETALRMTQEALGMKEEQLQAVNGAKEQAETVLHMTQEALGIKEEQLQAVNGAKEQAETVLHMTQQALEVKENQLQNIREAKEKAEADLHTIQETLEIKDHQLQIINMQQEMLRIELDRKQQELMKSEERYIQIQSTFSWKATKVIRIIESFFKGEPL